MKIFKKAKWCKFSLRNLVFSLFGAVLVVPLTVVAFSIQFKDNNTNGVFDTGDDLFLDSGGFADTTAGLITDFIVIGTLQAVSGTVDLADFSGAKFSGGPATTGTNPDTITVGSPFILIISDGGDMIIDTGLVADGGLSNIGSFSSFFISGNTWTWASAGPEDHNPIWLFASMAGFGLWRRKASYQG